MSDRRRHHADPAALETLKARISAAFPYLHVLNRGETVVVTGWFPLIDNGTVVDRYKIEIELPRDYPRGLPVLRELGGRIPRLPNRHVQDDGQACLFVPDEFWYRYPDGMDLFDLLKGPVLGFLVGQSLAEQGEPWPHGERGHGAQGIIEFYQELLGTTHTRRIRDYLEVLAAKGLRGHWLCPCGSGSRIRDCHRDLLGELRSRIPPSAARASLQRMAQDLKNQ